MKTRERLIALLLALLMLLALAACGATEDEDENEEETTAEAESGGKPGETGEKDPPAAEIAGPTLWDAKIQYEFLQLPESALKSETSRAVAMSPKGQLLIEGRDHAPYLWDTETERVTELTIANETSEEIARSALLVAATSQIREREKREAFLEEHPELRTISGEALLEALFTAGGFSRTTVNLSSAQGNILCLVDSAVGYSFLLDADTGVLTFMPERCQVVGVQDGLAVCFGYTDVGAALTLVDPETAAAIPVSFAFAEKSFSEPDGSRVAGGGVLIDGSLYAVLVPQTFSSDAFENGQECVLAIRRPDGGTESYPIGLWRSGREPVGAFSADGRHIALRTSSWYIDPSVLVDCGSGEVTLPVLNGRKPGSVPIAEATREAGRYLPPEGAEWIAPLAQLADGQTLLACTAQGGGAFLFRPETQELDRAFGSDAVLPVAELTGNGYDRWFLFETRSLPNTWISLSVK